MIKNEVATKLEVARSVHEKTGYTVREVLDIMDSLNESIQEKLVEGYHVNMPGVGYFRLRTAKGRDYFDFKSRTKIFVPDHTVLRFKPSKILKDLLREVDEEDL